MPLSDYFSLNIRHKENITNIVLRLGLPFAHTDEIPQTLSILRQDLPGIFETECFNNKDIPFEIEAKNTEIGHLFEHILLEYLCQIKCSLGSEDICFNGETSWNWKRDKFGTFHISVSAGLLDIKEFYLALEKSIYLLEKIIKSKTTGFPKIYKSYFHSLSLAA